MAGAVYQLRYVKLHKDKVHDFLERLKAFGPLYGPKKISEKFYNFLPIEDVHEVEFKYNRTIEPPKKFFHAPHERMFTYDRESMEMVDACSHDDDCSSNDPFILFGLHACDVIALRIIDSLFMDDQPDPYYVKRRKRGIIIGLSCWPDEYCFCNVRRADYADTGFDLFFHEVSDAYVIRVGTVTGHEMVDQNIELFDEVTSADTAELLEWDQKRRAQLTLGHGGNWDDVRYLLELARDDPIWEREAAKCLGCGNCTLTCPTCRCYDVKDYPELDGKTGSRERFWDSCQFRSHGLVAGNHNFRETKTQRFQNRYMCKNAYTNLTLAYCVGCGRCTAFCPADINYKENLMEIKGLK